VAAVYEDGFRLYRKLEKGEFFVCFGDTAQGGVDKNFTQFGSKTKMDIPLVMSMHGVAAMATPYIHQALEWIFDQTGVRPVFAFERQNGGASEMHNLYMMNKNNKYTLYQTKRFGSEQNALTDTAERWGWDTNTVTRPKMLGDWKVAYEAKQIKLYDKETLEHHQTFIVNKNGKPEADSGQHDDGVMSCAGWYQLYMSEHAPMSDFDDVEQYQQLTSFGL